MDKSRKTIDDFSGQWKIHGTLPDDFWTSNQMFLDYLCDLVNPSEFEGQRIAEIGSGSGRIIRMLSVYNPKKLVAVEPSPSIQVLKNNTRDIKNLEIQNVSGDKFELSDFDTILSLGVIHHIPDPEPVVRNIYKSLRKGGKFIIWVYGIEGNELYYFFYKYFSKFTKVMPDPLLNILSDFLQLVVFLYGKVSQLIFKSKLPMSDYINNVFNPCSRTARKYIVFDQLNPEYAKYYKSNELFELLKKCGFGNIEIKQRHAYSHTAVATK
jgi:SAM-dependent methyltransferase